jgi:hypothetical protein
MITHFKKVLYLGSWNHIEVVNYFHKCNEFVLIDTQPRSEHDEKDYFYEGFYRDKFIDRIINTCNKYGFILTDKIELDPNYMKKKISNMYPYVNPHLFIFKNSDRIIKYYISTNILFNMNKMLEDDIKTSDTLYVAGYAPDVELLKYLNNKINFIGDNETVYFYERDPDENNIISNYIEGNIKLDNYFDNYYLVWRQKSMLIICNSLEDIDNKKHEINKLCDHDYQYSD